MFTYDLNSPIGQLRLLLQDTVEPGIFQDEELSVFLQRTQSDLNMAASLGWNVIAGTRSLQAKKKTIGKFSYDLSVIARECREQASLFRELSIDTPSCDYAEMVVDEFSARNVRINQGLRGY